ncbi:outer membrane lipoprotein-sorting protein [Cupriavidus sp. H18C2]|uniref:outer membrane lipoprotein-sorting protein n=1 Tax=Cupriavidus sp. H18C2 TaxID=3241602 RepID=UPI003BF8C16A
MMRTVSRLAVLLFVLAAVPVHGETSAGAPDPGEAIAAEAYARERGFDSYRMDMEMILRDRQGRESVRRMRGAVLEVADDGDKHLIVFEAPADIKHTAFLTFSHADKPDDQWLYLPSLKRTRRIASDNRSGSFLGSEFSFEDLTSQLPRKFSHTLVGEETVADRPSFKLERVPRYEGSGYTRQLLWIDKERWVTLKTEFYDRRGALQKTLETGGYERYEGRLLKPAWMSMLNHQTGKSTRINMRNYRFRESSINRQDFLPQRLEYVR